MKFKQNTLAAAVALVLGGQVYAQQELPPTVVEAESIERDAVIEIIGIDDINNQKIDNFDDLVRRIPGVSVSRGDDRWGSSGFNIRGLDEDRVAINVDGMPQGETLKYEGGQAYGYFKGNRNGVDIEALRSIEVVKGADAILSGSGSLAGAVNMTTKDPDDFLALVGNDIGGSIKLGYSGVNDEAMGSFSLANRVGKVESLLIYTHRSGHEFENYDMGGLDISGSAREIPDEQDNELNSVLVKLIYEFSPGNEFGIVGSYYDQNRKTDVQSFNGGWYSNRMGDDTGETKRIGIFHEYSGATALFDNISSSLDYQTVLREAITQQRVTINIPPFFSSDEERTSTRYYDQEFLQLKVDMDKSLTLASLNHELTYGLDLLNKEFTNAQLRVANSYNNDNGDVSSNRGALVPASEADIVTFYAIDTFSLSDSTQVRLGLRYDDYSYDAMANADYSDDTGTLGEISFSTTTWTIGLEQSVTDNVIFEIGVSTGFRAPTIEDMYQTSGDLDDWSFVPNASLKSEYSTNLDVAFSVNFDAGNYRVGIFHSDYDDFIDTETRNGINPNIIPAGTLDPDGFSVPVNSDEVTIYGFELSTEVDLGLAFGFTQGLSTILQAAYTRGESKNGDPVYSIQPLNLSWTLDYLNPAGTWGASLFASYNSGKKNDDSFSTDASGLGRTYPLYLSNTATVIDLFAFYNINSHFRFTAGVNNLTDKEYYNWDSVRFVDQGDLRPGIGVTDEGIKRYSEAGRTFELGLNYQF